MVSIIIAYNGNGAINAFRNGETESKRREPQENTEPSCIGKNKNITHIKNKNQTLPQYVER